MAATLHKPRLRRTVWLPRGSIRMLCIWVLIVLFVTVPLALATPGEVAGEGGSTASPAARYGDLSQTERIQAIRGFIERGDLDTAQLLLANSRFDEGDLGYQAAFLQTVVLERRGELAEAERLSRAILAERPDFDLVRVHLARILARQGNSTGATYHLRLLAESSSDRTSRERFESFIDALDASRPFTVGGFISFAPSTNVNNGSSGTQVMLGGLPFTIDEGGRAQSGMGVRAGLNAGYSHALNEQFTLYTAGSAVFSDYSGKDFDTLVGDLRVGMRYRTASRMLSAEFIADRRWFSTTPSDYGIGGRIFGSQALMPKLIASGELLFIDRTYDDIRRRQPRRSGQAEG
ncbi:surface lipoprotein assembly modifier [Rhizobium sp. EC-SD404]|uniref:surface lipoprotein assembly modifier n=1 Tax=Rhizobium sp. EC-SD404 TaxID=2038389 RepID=UPI0018FE74CB|nr:surface lipoprotein assembly modifier [Rhizobium sp. EC-SD404]